MQLRIRVAERYSIGHFLIASIRNQSGEVDSGILCEAQGLEAVRKGFGGWVECFHAISSR
jgi:hypothetical protein